MLTAILALVLVVAFAVLDRRLRSDEQAQTFRAGAPDRASTLAAAAAFGFAVVCLEGSPFLARVPVAGIASAGVRWAGLGVAVAGAALRVWANLALGSSYTRTFRVREEQTVVSRGPYRFVRHRGYLGTLVLWAGALTAGGDWLLAVVGMGGLAIAYVYRMGVEEAMLLERFGQAYGDYRARTWRLLPGIY